MNYKLIPAQEEDVNEEGVRYVCYLKNGKDLITHHKVMLKLRKLGVGEIWEWIYDYRRAECKWSLYET